MPRKNRPVPGEKITDPSKLSPAERLALGVAARNAGASPAEAAAAAGGTPNPDAGGGRRDRRDGRRQENDPTLRGDNESVAEYTDRMIEMQRAREYRAAGELYEELLPAWEKLKKITDPDLRRSIMRGPLKGLDADFEAASRNLTGIQIERGMAEEWQTAREALLGQGVLDADETKRVAKLDLKLNDLEQRLRKHKMGPYEGMDDEDIAELDAQANPAAETLAEKTLRETKEAEAKIEAKFKRLVEKRNEIEAALNAIKGHVSVGATNKRRELDAALNIAEKKIAEFEFEHHHREWLDSKASIEAIPEADRTDQDNEDLIKLTGYLAEFEADMQKFKIGPYKEAPKAPTPPPVEKPKTALEKAEETAEQGRREFAAAQIRHTELTAVVDRLNAELATTGTTPKLERALKTVRGELSDLERDFSALKAKPVEAAKVEAVAMTVAGIKEQAQKDLEEAERAHTTLLAELEDFEAQARSGVDAPAIRKEIARCKTAITKLETDYPDLKPIELKVPPMTPAEIKEQARKELEGAQRDYEKLKTLLNDYEAEAKHIRNTPTVRKEIAKLMADKEKLEIDFPELKPTIVTVEAEPLTGAELAEDERQKAQKQMTQWQKERDALLEKLAAYAQMQANEVPQKAKKETELALAKLELTIAEHSPKPPEVRKEAREYLKKFGEITTVISDIVRSKEAIDNEQSSIDRRNHEVERLVAESEEIQRKFVAEITQCIEDLPSYQRNALTLIVRAPPKKNLTGLKKWFSAWQGKVKPTWLRPRFFEWNSEAIEGLEAMAQDPRFDEISSLQDSITELGKEVAGHEKAKSQYAENITAKESKLAAELPTPPKDLNDDERQAYEDALTALINNLEQIKGAIAAPKTIPKRMQKILTNAEAARNALQGKAAEEERTSSIVLRIPNDEAVKYHTKAKEYAKERTSGTKGSVDTTSEAYHDAWAHERAFRLLGEMRHMNKNVFAATARHEMPSLRQEAIDDAWDSLVAYVDAAKPAPGKLRLVA